MCVHKCLEPFFPKAIAGFTRINDNSEIHELHNKTYARAHSVDVAHVLRY